MIAELAIIALSITLLIITMTIGRYLGNRYDLSPEIKRKFIHAALGLYSLTFPFIFKTAWAVATLCLIATIALTVIRIIPQFRQSLGSGLHDVERFSMGELFFAFSIGLLFFISGDEISLYIVPLLILTLSDAAAALVGVSYGKNLFAIDDGAKSIEGTVIFFITAWLLSLIALLLFSDLPKEEVIIISLIVSMVGALIEAVSWKGLDNLLVPVCLFLLLDRAFTATVTELALLTLIFAFALITITFAGSRIGESKHMLITVVTTMLFVWIVGDWPNLVSPAALVALFIFLKFQAGETNTKDENLPFTLSIIGSALFWFFVSEVFSYNTYYVFNITMGIHMILLALFRKESGGVIFYLAILFLPWMVINVRILFVTDYTQNDFILSASALLIMALALVLFQKTKHLFTHDKWLKQTCFAVTGASLGIPLTVAL